MIIKQITNQNHSIVYNNQKRNPTSSMDNQVATISNEWSNYKWTLWSSLELFCHNSRKGTSDKQNPYMQPAQSYRLKITKLFSTLDRHHIKKFKKTDKSKRFIHFMKPVHEISAKLTKLYNEQLNCPPTDIIINIPQQQVTFPDHWPSEKPEKCCAITLSDCCIPLLSRLLVDL